MMSEEIENPISRRMFDRLTTNYMEHDEKCRLGKMSDAQIVTERIAILADAMGYAVAALEVKLNKLIELSGYVIE